MAKRQRGDSYESGGDRAEVATPLRIIGGKWRGSKLEYSGDLRTRPMKDRVREAVFNLIGPSIRGSHAVDVFAGSGAIGLEALSRGAARATFVEQHFPTADLIQQNLRHLAAEDQADIVPGNAFIWARRLAAPDGPPWAVFISPPWALFVEKTDDMLALIERVCTVAPIDSAIVVEADELFDTSRLPHPGEWDFRKYPPAVVALWRKVTGN